LATANESKFKSLMHTIREIKLLHANYAQLYRKNRLAAIDLARRIYGTVTTTAYETEEVRPDSTTQLFLAALIAERYLLKKYRNKLKHATISIVGMGGAGKTTYSVLSAFGALKLLGFSDHDALKIVDELTFFTSADFVKYARKLVEERLWVPFIILDDIGSQISKYWIFLGQHYWSYLFSVLDQLKDWCGVLILTARSSKSIAAHLRELSDLYATASEVDIDNNVLDVFIFSDTEEKAKSKTYGKFLDVLLPSAEMPDTMWNRMLETRRETGKKRLEALDETLDLMPIIEERKMRKLKEKLEQKLKRAEVGEEDEPEIPDDSW